MLTRVPSTLPADVEDVMHRVIGAAIEVHRHLGPGYLESTYHRALCIELRLRGIAFEVERHIEVVYKGERLHGQDLDLIVESRVVVEVKAVSQLEEIHGSQVVSYLRSTRFARGIADQFQLGGAEGRLTANRSLRTRHPGTRQEDIFVPFVSFVF